MDNLSKKKKKHKSCLLGLVSAFTVNNLSTTVSGRGWSLFLGLTVNSLSTTVSGRGWSLFLGLISVFITGVFLINDVLWVWRRGQEVYPWTYPLKQQLGLRESK